MVTKATYKDKDGDTFDISCCSTCKWYEEFNGACTNGESKSCADFTNEDSLCDKWKIIKGGRLK